MTLVSSGSDKPLPLADMHPAARLDALHMLDGCLRHPVTRAIRNDALG